MNAPTYQANITIDDLPAEMICELFKHLHLKDLLTCSMVNKRWQSIYSSFKLDRLAVIGHQDHFFREWCYPRWLVRDEEVCCPEMFNRLASKPLVSNLKHFALCDHLNRIDLNNLNRFGQLLSLTIKTRHIPSKSKLSLPKLKVLAFEALDSANHLSIDCP